MDLNALKARIKEKFSPRKKVDFDEEDLHFELEPLSAKDEIRVLEGCKDIDDSSYIEALKRHSLAGSIKKINDIEFGDKDVEYEDENGEKVLKSKFLYMRDFLSEWPNSLIDVLFDAFTTMSKEIETKIITGVKFDRLNISEESQEEETKPVFHRVKESETAPDLTDVEKMNDKVNQEVESRAAHMSETENKVMN